jgi:hypothetical protein
MITYKRRREILSDMKEGTKEFVEAWRLAGAYGKAGDTVMRDYFMKSVKGRKSKLVLSPEEKAWVIELANKRFMELAAQDAERRQQGLPPPEYKLPSFH